MCITGISQRSGKFLLQLKRCKGARRYLHWDGRLAAPPAQTKTPGIVLRPRDAKRMRAPKTMGFNRSTARFRPFFRESPTIPADWSTKWPSRPENRIRVAWRIFSARRTEADYQTWRNQHDWTARRIFLWCARLESIARLLTAPSKQRVYHFRHRRTKSEHGARGWIRTSAGLKARRVKEPLPSNAWLLVQTGGFGWFRRRRI
jgi:hypothetical protein